MLSQFLALAVVALQAPPITRVPSPAPAPLVVTTGDRIARPAGSEPFSSAERIALRITSPRGLLWEGTLRVAQNQSASHHQNTSQAAADRCPPGSPYDRSERSHLNVSVNAQHGQQWGLSYRVDVSWQRPVQGEVCVENGTRTVQINQTIPIAPGETGVIEGDAGLRVQLSRVP